MIEVIRRELPAEARPAHPASEEDLRRAVGNILDQWDLLPNDVATDPSIDGLGRAVDELRELVEGEQARPEPDAGERIEEAVREAFDDGYDLPGEVCAATRECLVEEIVDRLRRLHFGAVAGELRARRALEELKDLADKRCREDGWDSRMLAATIYDILESELSQPPSEPAAALEELLGELEEEAVALRKLEGESQLSPGTYRTAAGKTEDIARRLRKAVGWEVNDG